jgi:hypothetical protein
MSCCSSAHPADYHPKAVLHVAGGGASVMKDVLTARPASAAGLSANTGSPRSDGRTRGHFRPAVSPGLVGETPTGSAGIVLSITVVNRWRRRPVRSVPVRTSSSLGPRW